IDMIHIPRIYRLINKNRPLRLEQQNQHQSPIITFEERFSKRILNDYELTQLNNELSSLPFDFFNGNKELFYNHVSKFLAVRWALKEATYKAIYPMYKLTWKEITIKKIEGAKPSVYLNVNNNNNNNNNNDIIDFIKTIKIHCSVSHEKNIVISQVIIEK
ncbi:10858_t:CDS:2, partial [Entrophospora sp. SA101]